MSIWHIYGGNRLTGSTRVQGAKNAVLPIMAASVLSGGETVLHNVPDLRDVTTTLRILQHLGCTAVRDGDTVRIDSRGMHCDFIPHALMRELRSSVIFLGAILARFGTAELSLPGGCVLGARPIDLHLRGLRRVDDLTVIFIERVRCVKHRDGERRVRRCVQCPVHADGLHGVGRVAQPGGIGQAQEHAAERYARVDRVAGRAGHVGHDRALIAEQGIEQGGLARVRAAENHGGHAAVEHICPGKRVQQALQLCDAVLHGGLISIEPEIRNVLIGVVDHGVIVTGDVLQRIIYTLCAPQHRAAELTGGIFRIARGLGVDEVNDGFGLREIHASVEKGALGELTRRCLPRAEGEESFQRGAQHDGRAMALKLCGVLAGVASRRAGERAETEIERPSLLVEQLAVNELPVAVLRHGLSVRRAEKRVHQRYGKGTRYAHDADGGNACAGRNGGNGITHLSSFFAQGSFLLSS